jgi:hypothetical protein
MPVPQINNMFFNWTSLKIDFIFANKPKLITVNNIRHQTKGIALREFTAPRIAVNPNNTMEKCKDK